MCTAGTKFGTNETSTDLYEYSISYLSISVFSCNLLVWRRVRIRIPQILTHFSKKKKEIIVYQNISCDRCYLTMYGHHNGFNKSAYFLQVFMFIIVISK